MKTEYEIYFENLTNSYYNDLDFIDINNNNNNSNENNNYNNNLYNADSKSLDYNNNNNISLPPLPPPKINGLHHISMYYKG